MDDTGAAPRTSTGKVSDPDLKLQAIERLLLLTQRYITVVEVHAICILCTCIHVQWSLSITDTSATKDCLYSEASFA